MNLIVNLPQVLNLLAFIAASVASSKYTANAQVTIFLFVSMISFWISLFIVCFYLFRFDEKLDSISFSTFVSFCQLPEFLVRESQWATRDLPSAMEKTNTFDDQFTLQGFYYSCVSSIAYLASSLSLIFLGGFLAAACVSWTF